MEEFQALDWILLLCGCKVFTRTRFLVILNNLQSLVLFIISFLQMADIVIVALSNRDHATYLLAYYAPYYVYQILVLVILRNKKTQLHTSLLQMSSGISPDRKKVLKNNSTRYALLYVAFSLVTWINFLYGAVMYQQRESTDSFSTAAWYIELYILLCYRWILSTCLICAFFIKAMSSFELTFLHQLHHRVKQQQASPHDALIDIQKVALLKKQLMSLFGIIPCLVVMYLFGAGAGIIMKVKRGPVTVYTIFEIVILLSQILSLLYLTYVADKCTHAAEQACEVIESTVLAIRSEKWQQVIVPLRSLCSMQHESCRLFTLNPQFFLTFLSSLITFTALLTQIFVDISHRN